jgi:RF-1 domain
VSCYLDLTDAQLLSQCKFEAYRASGPGGQKRNKTSSAIRLTHAPTGIAVIANESRSQHENKSRGLRRLRHQIALEIREPFQIGMTPLPIWITEVPPTRRLKISAKSENYLPAVALVLDILAAGGWSVRDAADSLGVTTAHLSSFLRDDEKLWAEVNHRREKTGLKKLVGG